MDIGLLILRVVVGGLLFGHGAQKLFGWFGGHGLQGTGGWLESMGFRPGRAFAVVNGASETFGGVLLAMGLLTPLGSAAIIGVMTVATIVVHWKNGVWVTAGGYELTLTNIAAAAALGFVGPGAYSLDAALGLDLAGWTWGLGALALGIVPALVTMALRRRPVAAPEASDEESREAA